MRNDIFNERCKHFFLKLLRWCPHHWPAILIMYFSYAYVLFYKGSICWLSSQCKLHTSTFFIHLMNGFMSSQICTCTFCVILWNFFVLFIKFIYKMLIIRVDATFSLAIIPKKFKFYAMWKVKMNLFNSVINLLITRFLLRKTVENRCFFLQ